MFIQFATKNALKWFIPTRLFESLLLYGMMTGRVAMDWIVMCMSSFVSFYVAQTFLNKT